MRKTNKIKTKGNRPIRILGDFNEVIKVAVKGNPKSTRTSKKK